MGHSAAFWLWHCRERVLCGVSNSTIAWGVLVETQRPKRYVECAEHIFEVDE